MGDVSGLGLKVGLEIHQQLEGRKLFCHCPTDLSEHEPDVIVTRRLRASAGEMGDVDAAAAAEQRKRKRYLYNASQHTSCLVELDEEPPRPASEQAIVTAVMVAKAFHSTILPRVQFMRKTIVDGSAVSGFQRTGLLALGGTIPELEPAVRIQTICVEEDAAKLLSRAHDEDAYDLNRLGIPLIEVATEPDITTPEQAKAAAAQIGMILRSTRRVKRGLGTIRQDLNVSIIGGTRIEIKGCQDLRLIPTYITNEALRQRSLIELREVLKERTISVGMPQDVSAAFAHSKVGFIKKSIASGKAIGIRVANFAGIFGRELCPNYRVGSELADLARAKGFGGLIHSDESMEKYGADAPQLRTLLQMQDNDAFIVLIGNPVHATTTLHDLIIPRIHALCDGVPREVRKANDDATTSFLRPISGGARMYPETDIPIVEVPLQGVHAPRLLTEEVRDVAALTGLSLDTARAAIDAEIDLVAIKERHPKLSYAFLANAFIDWVVEVQTRVGVPLTDARAYVEQLLPLVQRDELTPSSVKAVLEDLAMHEKEKTAPVPVEDVLRYAGAYQKLDDSAVREAIKEIIRTHPGAPMNGLMGVAMAQLRGKADGKLVQQFLREELG